MSKYIHICLPSRYNYVTSSKLMLLAITENHKKLSTLRKAPYTQLDDITEVKSHYSGKHRSTAACRPVLRLLSVQPHVASNTQNGFLIVPRGLVTLTTWIFWRRLRLSRTRVCLDITTYHYISHQVEIARVLGSILCSRSALLEM